MFRPSIAGAILVALANLVSAATLDDVCTPEYVAASLPADKSIPGVLIDSSSVTAVPVVNYTSQGSGPYTFCDVNFEYSHAGRDDAVKLNYWVPAPDDFKNRYVSTGGDGWDITTQNSTLPQGLEYGAVTGTTDGGFGGFDVGSDEVWLSANGTIDWQTIEMLGYQGIYELGAVGKAFTKAFYNMTETDTKLYAYYDGCSEGGREGWSQVQRFGEELDGVLVGAPGIRWSLQNVNHLWSTFVQYELNYYPNYCELEKIVNLTIAACDGLDGKVDGVVSRTDLCKSNFNVNSTIGEPYSCSATAEIPDFMPYIPAANGTVTAKGAAVAQGILDGAKDSKGRQLYVSYQPTADFQDGVTDCSDNGTCTAFMNLMGGLWVPLGVDLVENVTLANYDNVTGDTFRDWMMTGFQRYQDTLETNYPDLTPFLDNGGKIIHYHGESDPQVPTASSVRYYESVRGIMYPDLTYNASVEELNAWYRLFLIPGAGHCSSNPLEPGPFPETPLLTLIDWVEQGVEPVTLNGTITGGPDEGDQQQICSWPLRPFWTNNGSTFECEYSQTSIESWTWDLDGIKIPIY